MLYKFGYEIFKSENETNKTPRSVKKVISYLQKASLIVVSKIS